MAYCLGELPVDLCIEGIGGLATLVLLVTVVDVFPKGVQLLAQLVSPLRVVLARHREFISTATHIMSGKEKKRRE